MNLIYVRLKIMEIEIQLKDIFIFEHDITSNNVFYNLLLWINYFKKDVFDDYINIINFNNI